MNDRMTYLEWIKLYNEALACADYQTCDTLAEDYPQHSDAYFMDESEGEDDTP